MKMNKNRFSSFIYVKHIAVFEISIGIIANIVLLLFQVLTFLLERKVKPTDLTIGHLAFIHLVMLLTVTFIAIDDFGYQVLGDYITCTSVIYLNRLTRELSISNTCLLSVLQAITLSPRSSCLAKFKQKSLHQNLLCFLFLWVFNSINSTRILISTVATPNVTSPSFMFLTKSCSLFPIRSFLKYIFLSLVAFNYMTCIGLISLSSGYMVILLCRHKRQSQHLHRTSLSPKVSPEQRATKTILLLMSFFIIFYSLDCIIRPTSSIVWSNDPIHNWVLMLVGNSYATISSLLLTSSERRMTKCFIFVLRRDGK
ncbi:vomeronasal type-1 receptor 90-like [Octodon degus]|uniref:Vomeronasal type-1 receptor n=1 Tax=Octodon degus TaxID=10160 RepID=A0A6P3FYZ0_OCTDE|nr:vomeronasal type-1 receptor 90-like [Octodon degus]